MSLFCFQDCIISDKRSPVITVLSFSLQEICPFSFGYLQDFFFIFHFEQFDWRVWLWSMSLFWDNSWPLSLHIFHLPNSLFLLLLWFHSVVLYCPVALGHSFLFHSFFFLSMHLIWIIYGCIFKFTGSFLSYVKSADESIKGIHFQYCGFSYQVFPFGSP